MVSSIGRWALVCHPFTRVPCTIRPWRLSSKRGTWNFWFWSAHIGQVWQPSTQCFDPLLAGLGWQGSNLIMHGIKIVALPQVYQYVQTPKLDMPYTVIGFVFSWQLIGMGTRINQVTCIFSWSSRLRDDVGSPYFTATWPMPYIKVSLDVGRDSMWAVYQLTKPLGPPKKTT